MHIAELQAQHAHALFRKWDFNIRHLLASSRRPLADEINEAFLVRRRRTHIVLLK